MATDARGIPLTGADDFAAARYDTALTQFASYVGDPIATLDEALAACPGFVGAHLMKALAMYTLAERQFVAPVADAANAARALVRDASDRERGLLAAVDLLVAGQWPAACRVLDDVLAWSPRDVLALQTGHLMDFYRGDAQNLRNRVSRVLPHWDDSMPGYSYVLGMHAFGLEEMNQYPEAEATARRALDLEPRDGWAVHAAVHVMEMQGRGEEGAEFLAAREGDWAPDNAFAFHNFWHLALFRLDDADYAGALDLFDRHILPGPAQFALSLVDATALLWRLRLERVDVGTRMDHVADQWQARLPAEAGFYAFNDAHAAMAFADTGRHEALAQLVAAMERAAAGSDANAAMTREVGVPLVEGVAAFARGRYRDAAAMLQAMRDGAHRFGGSHAQRDVITLTLVEAALRDGDRVRARHHIAERRVHRRVSGLGERLWARAT
jgi:tetratricopeptide (TPR) repeat protein